MELVLYEVKERIGYITLNRPEKRNALSFELVADLKEAFAQAENDSAVKVIVLQANGEAFCAGADLAYLQELQKFSFEENLTDSNHLKELFLKIYQLKKVVIAKVQGHALAGDIDMVLAVGQTRERDGSGGLGFGAPCAGVEAPFIMGVTAAIRPTGNGDAGTSADSSASALL